MNCDTEETMGYCENCNNTGWVNCYCGGDLCVCENNGEEECPVCGGMPDRDDDGDYDYEYGEPEPPAPKATPT